MSHARARKPRNRAFAIALVVSALFHLSMVSVFSIVIWFPHSEMVYYVVGIIEQPSGPALSGLAGAGGARLRVPDPGRPLAEGADDALPGLPPIELTRLEFTGLEMIRSREEGLRIGSKFSGLFEKQPLDTWGRFSQELKGIGSRLSRWRDEDGAASRVGPQWVSEPAPGFAAHIEWLSEPKDRELLFSPAIRALLAIEPSQLREPIVLVFKVNPSGKVTEVQIPIEDDEGLVTSVGSALLKYRFGLLDGKDAGDQRGTFLVMPAGRAR